MDPISTSCEKQLLIENLYCKEDVLIVELLYKIYII